MPIQYQIIITALVSAFIVLLISKLGFRDYIITRGPSVVSKLFSCDFCLCFWLSVIVSVFLFLAQSPHDALFIIVPICSTPIARYLL